MVSFLQDIRASLDAAEQYRPCLFPRAYLVTDASLNCLDRYPFYNLWQHHKVKGFSILTHPDTKAFFYEHQDTTAVLIGHACNPFTGEIHEEAILRKILAASHSGKAGLMDAVNELTGVFVLFLISSEQLWAVQDCGGQKMLYFGRIGGYLVVSSAPQLVGDVFDLKWNPDIERLLHTKGYYRGSGFLPGNLSPYKELTRLGCNTALSYCDSVFHIERIYPAAQRVEFQTPAEQAAAIEEMYRIFSANIALTMKKWPRVGLSLTGGMDSKTTFACAKPYYGKFFCYSFSSKESEQLDADAAKQICDAVGVAHHFYAIPQDSSQLPNYELLHQIIEHNTSHICKLHPNEIRKYIYLRDRHDFDVEIKSDMSEVGRAYTSRKYYKVKIPRVLAPRHMTITQARYFLEPWAMRFADAAFQTMMDETGLTDDINGYSMQDLAYWEVRMASWAATSFASQEYIHEITIPYNNRKLLDLFLRFPEADRLADAPHKLLMKRGNPEVAALDISIKDSYLGKKRMLLETAYYYYATKLNTCGKR